MQEGTYSVITGTRPDDEVQDIAEELTHILQTIAPLGLFEDEPWYTTRLGPEPSASISPFRNDYIDMAFAYGQGILQPGRRVSNRMPVETPVSETQAVDGTTHIGVETDERWYRGPETELDPYLRHALTQTYSGGALGKWNEEWTQLEDLEAFLKDRLAPFFPKDFIDNTIQWGRLTGFGMIHMHRSLMEALWNEHWSVDRALDPWVSSLNEEFADADDLLSAVSANPLVNEARLIEEFGYASIEEARDDFLAQVQYAYEKFGIQPPKDLHEWSPLELANELYGLLKNVYEPYYEGESGSENFQKAYEFIADPEFNDLYVYHPTVTISRLEGSHQTSPMELVFFVASFFIEPLDWAITIGDMISAAEDQDWEQVVLLGLIGFAPGALGRLVKRGKAHELLKSNELLEANELLDEAVNAARVNSKVAASSGSIYLKQADGLLAIPGYPGRKDLREQLKRVAEYDPSQAWRAPDPGTLQEAHHMVPQGDKQAKIAREILEEKGISLHSYHNGIALEKHVHDLTRGRGRGEEYVKAVNQAILRRRHLPRDEIELFLEDLALRFDELNAPEVDFVALFETEIMDWLRHE